eukprot:TRINITY_DN19599_c0_g1_i2.p1 TRINITY_DN19599_c0_g1~~TRINITY_DN19599_c0_g1_i2.p1  ORF type:complete len:126 (+),score=19.54 TRINITY_DN19599_c0_g1_i2:137-514(+)
MVEKLVQKGYCSLLRTDDICLIVTSMMSLRVRSWATLRELSTISTQLVSSFTPNQLVLVCTSFASLSLRQDDNLINVAIPEIKQNTAVLTPANMESFLKLLSRPSLEDLLDAELGDGDENVDNDF